MSMTQEQINKLFPHEVNGIRYSDKKVCRSNAGYYIGTMCWVDEYGGYEEPGSRESDYYKTREKAQAALNLDVSPVRDCDENKFAYSQGLPPPKGYIIIKIPGESR